MPEPEKQTKNCPDCKAVIGKNEKKCPACGSDFEEMDSIIPTLKRALKRIAAEQEEEAAKEAGRKLGSELSTPKPRGFFDRLKGGN